MKQLIKFPDIIGCGVWHKAKQTRSSLDEAVAALGSDCVIINGNLFDTSTGKPNDAYTIDGVSYCDGGMGFGYAMRPPNTFAYSYLNWQKHPFFIGGSYMRLGESGVIEGTELSGTRRTGMGLTKDGVYINVTDKTYATIRSFLEEAKADGCVSCVNLDGGGSSQYALPDGTRYYGTDTKRKVLNWVWFRIKKEDKPVGVKTYYKSSMGGNNLSPNFKVKEFACKDGSDTILIDMALVEILEDIRATCGGKPCVINSGYRTVAYNAQVGGAANSYHTYGQAADIAISGVDPEVVCRAAEAALKKQGIPGGICLYVGRFAHIDTRTTRWRGRQDKSGGPTVNLPGWDTTPRPILRKGSTGEDVKDLQDALRAVEYGTFGPVTDAAVRAFQAAKGLAVDGAVGPKTYAKLGM